MDDLAAIQELPVPEATPWKSPWSRARHLRSLRSRPSVRRPEFVLWGTVESANRLREQLQPSGRGTVVVSPHQYRVTWEAGALHPWLEALIDWDEMDDLYGALHVASQIAVKFILTHSRTSEQAEAWGSLRHLCLPQCSALNMFANEIGTATRALIGLRTGRGLWCQTYSDGWTSGPPFLVPSEQSANGIVVTAALDPCWCPFLPFTPAHLEMVKTLCAYSEVAVRWEWHPEDDVLPTTAPGQGFLEPAAAADWL